MDRRLSDLVLQPYWIHRTPSQPQSTPLSSRVDFAIIGAGFTGLWAAEFLSRTFPDLSITVFEQDIIAGQATGRNGGFIHASLTHGNSNGMARWPDEMPQLIRAGYANLEEIQDFVAEHNIDCDWQATGELQVARSDDQRKSLQEEFEAARLLDPTLQWLDGSEVRQRLNSPLFQAAIYEPHGVGLINPVALAQGIARVLASRGVVIQEKTRVEAARSLSGGVQLTTQRGTVLATKVLWATNAWSKSHRVIRQRIAPVYDYSLVTRPLTESEWRSIGWRGGEGVVETSNLFHYYRPTPDGRILWGGYDAVYHFKNGIGANFENDFTSYEKLAKHFAQAFPTLAEVPFEFGWGGAIDTSTRFTPMWYLERNKNIAHVAGFTGLGVGSSRFAAHVAVKLLLGISDETTSLEMVRKLPFPFPPEPLKSMVIALTRWSLERADHRSGKRNLWLKMLDGLGIGFDS